MKHSTKHKKDANIGNQATENAFTLIEILVVIAILGVIAAILFPVLTNARVEGYKTQTLSQMKQLALSAVQYSSDAEDTLPYGFESEYLRQYPLNAPISNRHVDAPDLKAQLARYGAPVSFWQVPGKKLKPGQIQEGVYDVMSLYQYFLGPTKLSAVPPECSLFFSADKLHSPFETKEARLYRVLADGSVAYVSAKNEYKTLDECAEKRWPGQTGT